MYCWSDASTFASAARWAAFSSLVFGWARGATAVPPGTGAAAIPLKFMKAASAPEGLVGAVTGTAFGGFGGAGALAAASAALPLAARSGGHAASCAASNQDVVVRGPLTS